MTDIRDTSVEAFKELRDSGELSEREYNVLEWLSEYNESHEECATARELHQWLAVDQANEKAQLGGPNFVKPRLTELKEEGFVEEGEKRECSVTERKAYTLKVVGRQEAVVDEEDAFFVDEDGQRYVFDPTESDSDELVSDQASNDAKESGSETDENKHSNPQDDTGVEDESEADQKLLFDSGEVVG